MEYFNEDDAAREFNTWLADFSGEFYQEETVDAYA